MGGEVIKSFLVGLGFGIDSSSLAAFNKAIQSASLRVTALYGSIQLLAAGVFKGISGISESFEDLGYEFRIIAPMINKTLLLRRELLAAYSAAGINIRKTVQESVLFNLSLTKTKYALDAIYKSVGAKFFPLVTKQMDIFRSKIYANMPKIQAALEKAVNFVFKAFEATSILGARLFSILSRVWGFFVRLDEATGGWSTKILAVIAAWKLLNLSFLATPLGMIIGGMVALLALFDDFKTWQEGGESLFDWSALEPAIKAAIAAFGTLFEIIKGIATYISILVKSLVQLFHLDFAGFFSSIKDLGGAALNVLGSIVDHFKNIFSFGGALLTAFANATTPNIGAQPGASPILGGPSSNVANTQNHLSNQTSIIVQGSADANATGAAVASQQNQVNYNTTRNFQAVVR